MAASTEYSIVTTPRVRVLCALTGELIYEPTHPWLEQVRLHLLKKWTWINKGGYLPAALTVFYLHFEVGQQPMDDFQCLGTLMLGRPLDILCFVKAPQRPDIRHRKILGRRHWAAPRSKVQCKTMPTSHWSNPTVARSRNKYKFYLGFGMMRLMSAE